MPATVIQVLKAFDNPEGAIFSADGQHVFVSNAAEIGDRGQGFGWAEGEGYVSKLAVLPDGTLDDGRGAADRGPDRAARHGRAAGRDRQVPCRHDLRAPGSAPLVDENGQVVKDPARLQTKLVAFSEDGEVLGEIDTGQGSAFEQINGSPIVLINAAGLR